MSGLEPPNPPDRQPSPIPDSTLARNFSDQLDGLFNLGGELSGLSQSVEDKRQMISTQSRELELLEARLKAAETKLQQAGGQAAQRVPSGGSQPYKDVRDIFPESSSATSNGASAATTSRPGEAPAVGGSTQVPAAGQTSLGNSYGTSAQQT